MDRARKVSLDARAVDPRNETSEEGAASSTAISDEVARIYKATKDDKGTQLVFLDRSVPKAKGDDKIIKAYDELWPSADEGAGASRRRGRLSAAHRRAGQVRPERDRRAAPAQAGGWNAYDQIKQNLIKRGVRPTRSASSRRPTTTPRRRRCSTPSTTARCGSDRLDPAHGRRHQRAGAPGRRCTTAT
jgi:hypothetical protein